MRAADLKDVSFTRGFWADYRRLIRDEVIPYQWEALNDNVEDAEPSYAIRNFKIAAGLAEGGFGGMVFQDSDVAKWLEAIGYSLASHPDPELEEQADELIGYIERAQQADGYIDTYYILNKGEKRFSNLLDCHELYCLGHMIEAAVAYYAATGKDRLLGVVCRFADLVDSLFGPEEGKRKGYPGHQEIELALMKLYDATGNERYAKLAEFFINERGREPSYFIAEWEARGRKSHWEPSVRRKPELSYNQAHLPVREQRSAVGHAVRAVYMYSGMADVARHTGDATLLDACKRLWDNIVTKQMYITGGIGQTHHGEAFTFDYDLPNDTAYSETCAAIGLVFFAHRMLEIEGDARYADVMETALYNGIISGMEREGKRFFYVNPLEVWPEACDKDPGKRHVKSVRQKWFSCACCPPNLARLITSLGQYVYSMDGSTIYTHLYAGVVASFNINGAAVVITQETDYPRDPAVSMTVRGGGRYILALRLPGWCRNPEIFLNDKPAEYETRKGYAFITRNWAEDDRVKIFFPMPVEVMSCNINVQANAGKAALRRGPLVYCLEEADNGKNLSALRLMTGEGFAEEYDEALDAVAVLGKGERDVSKAEGLYFPAEESTESVRLRFVPYYAWGNRGRGEMRVWVRR